jgi:hypothetical protein
VRGRGQVCADVSRQFWFGSRTHGWLVSKVSEMGEGAESASDAQIPEHTSVCAEACRSH